MSEFRNSIWHFAPCLPLRDNSKNKIVLRFLNWIRMTWINIRNWIIILKKKKPKLGKWNWILLMVELNRQNHSRRKWKIGKFTQKKPNTHSHAKSLHKHVGKIIEKSVLTDSRRKQDESFGIQVDFIISRSKLMKILFFQHQCYLRSFSFIN